ncbi:hypothetical protein R1flu_021114 [Riccia fluitans]|uniref:Uncharacterized protein n=1 Tax=Riccia fluitans TaxID=41844 RepID=A0ABD1ZQE7_9MARC
MCWGSLWGTNRDGFTKKSLISWDTICRDRKEGGLGLGSFKQKSQLFKLKLLTRVLEGDPGEWALLAKLILQKDFKGMRKNRDKTADLAEILLVADIRNGEGIPTNEAHSLWMENVQIKVGFPVVLHLGKKYRHPRPKEWTQIYAWAKKLGVESMSDLTTGRIAAMISAESNDVMANAHRTGEGLMTK